LLLLGIGTTGALIYALILRQRAASLRAALDAAAERSQRLLAERCARIGELEQERLELRAALEAAHDALAQAQLTAEQERFAASTAQAAQTLAEAKARQAESAAARSEAAVAALRAELAKRQEAAAELERQLQNRIAELSEQLAAVEPLQPALLEQQEQNQRLLDRLAALEPQARAAISWQAQYEVLRSRVEKIAAQRDHWRRQAELAEHDAARRPLPTVELVAPATPEEFRVFLAARERRIHELESETRRLRGRIIETERLCDRLAGADATASAPATGAN
ncbi:MAG: hypothetical protein NZM12_13705, partial [Steroidobacteraceae bacterium]|nr:hypothetical protein [Steroidobacteraceae bacterium]